jgi:uncharacterized cupin superfamily protein
MNADKTEAMIMNVGKVCPKMFDHAYRRNVEGTGSTFLEIPKEKLQCEYCGAEINRGSLAQHHQSTRCPKGRKKHCPVIPIAKSMKILFLPCFFSPPQEYYISVNNAFETNCPMADCPYKAKTPSKMQMHFHTHHNDDTIVIEEEGKLPRCPSCGLFQCNVGRAHQQTKTCTEFSKILQEHRKYQENMKLVSETVFTMNNSPIKTVKEFKYLSHLLVDNDSDGPEVK